MNFLLYLAQNPGFITLIFTFLWIIFLIVIQFIFESKYNNLTLLLKEIDELPIDHPVRTKLVNFFSSKLYTYSGYEVISQSEIELKFTHLNEETIFLVSITRKKYWNQYRDFFDSLQLLLDSSDLVSMKD